MSIKVSVIIPTYNEELYIEKSIQSILNQTYENIEILVVDDESTDRTQEIVRSIDDSRVRLFVREEGDKGIPEARNFGIEKSNGEYIAGQDADDISLPQRIEKQVQLAEQENLDIVGTGSYNTDISGSILSRRNVPEDPNPTKFNAGSQFIHGSLIMRKEMLDNLKGYNPSYESGEDVDLLCRAVNSGYEFQNIDEPLYKFTVDENSKYRSDIRRTTLYGFYAVNKDRFEMDVNEFVDLPDEEIIDYMSNRESRMFYQEMAQENLRFGRKSESRDYCLKGIPYPRFLILLFLSYCPMTFVKWVVSIYRRL